MANNQINLRVGYTVDQTGLKTALDTLKDIQKYTTLDLKLVETSESKAKLESLKASALEIEKALNKSYSPNLGTYNITKFNAELKKIDLKKIEKEFSQMGAVGNAAFRDIITGSLTMNTSLKQSHKFLEKMGETLTNTIKWNISSSAVNSMSGSVQKAYYYVNDLDKSLNNIMIVTDKSSDNMKEFAKQANNAAKGLSASTLDYTNASLIYYQQGLSDEDVSARTETTLKAANVTQQAASAVSEQLTAVWNGYKVQASEAELYVDKLAAVAAQTAADLEELSTGMSKVASAANIMGVDIDQLNATLATVVSVTRQAPESVGTAFKTIYARMGDIEAGLDTETTLGAYTEQIKEIADINVLDTNGQLRDMGDVIEEVGNNWTNLSREQQIALSQVMAGTRQYNNLLSLFDNWDMYTKALNTSAEAAGTLQEQQDIYMESTEAHLQRMQTSAEDLFDSILDTESINTVIDGITDMTDALGTFVDGIGGARTLLLSLGSIGTKILSKQLAQGLVTTIGNFQKDRQRNIQAEAERDITQHFGDQVSNENAKVLIELKKQQLQVEKQLTEEEKIQSNNQLKEIAKLMEKSKKWQENIDLAVEYYNASVSEKEKISISEITGKTANTQLKDNLIQDLSKKIKEETKFLDEEENKWKDVIQATHQYNKELEKSGGLVKNLSKEGKQAEAILKKHKKETKKQYVNFQKSSMYKNASSEEQQEFDALFQTFEKTQYKNYLGIATKIRDIIADNDKLTLEDKKKALKALLEADKDYNQWLILSEEERSALLEKEKVKFAQSALNIVSSIGQITSAISSLSSIDDIWNDDSLSSLEKANQIFSSLTFTVPMLVTAITSVRSSYKDLKDSGIELIANLLLQKGALQATTIEAAKATVANQSLFTSIKLLELPLKKYIAIGALIVGTVGAIYHGIKYLTDAYNADAIAAEKAAEASEKAATAAKEAKSAYDELANGFDAYNDAIEVMKELTKDTQEYADAIENANEKARELVDIYPELAQYAFYNSEGLLEFKDGVEDVLAELNQNSIDARINANNKQIISNEASANSKYINASRGFGKNISVDSQVYDLNFDSNIKTTQYVSFNDETIKKLVELIQDNENSFVGIEQSDIESILNNQGLFSNDEVAILSNALEEIKPNIEALAEEISNLEASNKLLLQEGLLFTIQNQENNLETNEEVFASKVASTFIDNEKIKNNAQVQVDQLNDEQLKQNWITLNGYKQLKDGTIVDPNNDNKEVTFTNDEKEAIKAALLDIFIQEAAAEKGTDLVESLQGNITNESLYNAIIDYLNTGVFNIGSLDEEAMAEVQGKDIATFLGELLAGQNFDIITSILNESGYNKNTRNSTNEIFKDAQNNWYEARDKEIASLGGSMSELIKEFDSGELTKESEAFTAISNKIDMLKETYPELTAAADVFNNTNLIGTQTWAEALGQIENKINEIELKELADDFQETYDRIAEDLGSEDGNITFRALLASEDFEQHLKDLTDKDYAINVEIHTQAEEAYENTLASIDAIEEKASLIGENFIVAAEDVRELNNTFPGILANITDLKNGTIQLNQDVVKSAIEASKSEVLADVETTNKKLQNSADTLRAKQKTYQSAADAARALASAEIDSSDEAAKYEYLIQNGLNEMGSESTDAELENQETVATNANDNANILAENWNSAYQSASIDAAAFATIAIKANKAALGTDTGEIPKVGGFQVNYSGRSGKSAEATYLDEYQNLYDKDLKSEDLLKLASVFDQLAISAGESANDIEGMMVGNASLLSSAFTNLNSTGESKTEKNAKEVEFIELLEDEIDRYHDVNLQIEKLTTNLSRLENQQDKLTGSNLIDNLNEQIETLDKLNEKTKEKLAIAKLEQTELRQELSSQGVAFNSEGYIANYATILAQKLAEYQAVQSWYNSLSADEQEKQKAILEDAEETYNTFKEAIESYDDVSFSVIPELEDDVQDNLDKQIDAQIEKFTLKVELQLDMTEAQLDFNEFRRKVIEGLDEDDILGNAAASLEDLRIYFNLGEGEGSIQGLTQQINKTIADLNNPSVYGDNRQKALEDLEKYTDDLMDKLGSVDDAVKAIEQSYLDMIDEATAAFDDQVEKYEYINDLIDHDKNIITLLYGEDAYQELDSIYNRMKENNNAELDFLRQRVDYAKQQMDAATDEESRKKWQEEWEKSISSLNSKIQDALQTLVDGYVNNINRIADELEKKITKGLGLDYVNTEWDLVNKNADRYLDKVNAMYEVQDLEQKYLDAIANTDNVGAQKKLNDAMSAQLTMLREKDKLSQYDIDRANAMFELTLKEIALEEAQRNKSQMRLRRDSQGNYTYQFVSDQQQIAQAERDIAEAQREVFNIDKEQYRSNLDEINSIYEEFQQKMIELYADQTLSAEERERKEVLLVQEYQELINGIVGDNQVVRNNLLESTFVSMAGLYEADVEAFKKMGQEEKDIFMNDIIPQWQSGTQTMIDTFGEKGFIGTVSEFLTKLKDELDIFQEDLNETTNSAGGLYNEEVQAEMKELLNGNQDLIDSWNGQLDAVLGLRQELENLINTYKGVTDAAKKAAEAGYEYKKSEDQKTIDASNQDAKTSTKPTSTESNNPKPSTTTPTPTPAPTKQGNGVPDIGDVVTYTAGAHYDDEWGRTGGSSRGVGTRVKITKVHAGTQYPIHIVSEDGKAIYGWIKENQISGYKTGGYTGDFAGSKLGVLHEKELILNKADTQNILDAVSLVRNMDGLLSAMNHSITSRMMNFGSVNAFNPFTAANSQIEQNVHIEASFPNVSAAQEIEDALSDLVNLASMKAFNQIR